MKRDVLLKVLSRSKTYVTEQCPLWRHSFLSEGLHFCKGNVSFTLKNWNFQKFHSIFFVGFFPFDIFEAISTLVQEIQIDSSKDITNYSRRPGNINVGPGPWNNNLRARAGGQSQIGSQGWRQGNRRCKYPVALL